MKRSDKLLLFLHQNSRIERSRPEILTCPALIERIIGIPNNFNDYNPFSHITNGVVEDFGRIGCRRSARKYVTVKRSLSSTPISIKSLRRNDFKIFSNFDESLIKFDKV